MGVMLFIIALSSSGLDLRSVPTGVWVFLSSVVMLLLTKVAEQWLKRQSEVRSDRKEYRDEIKELRDRVESCEQQVALWRDRYYAEQTMNAGLRVLLIRNGINPGDHLIMDPIPPTEPDPQAP